MMQSSLSQLLHLVVLSLGDLPITAPVCHYGCTLGLEAKNRVSRDPSQIALCCYYLYLRLVVFKMWSPDLQKQHHLRSWLKYKVLDPLFRPTEPETPKVEPNHQKPSRCF